MGWGPPKSTIGVDSIPCGPASVFFGNWWDYPDPIFLDKVCIYRLSITKQAGIRAAYMSRKSYSSFWKTAIYNNGGQYLSWHWSVIEPAFMECDRTGIQDRAGNRTGNHGV